MVSFALDLRSTIVYNEGMMKTTNNVKSLGVPSEVHAKARELADRDSIKVYEVVAEGLRLYEAIHPTTNGDAEPQP